MKKDRPTYTRPNSAKERIIKMTEVYEYLRLVNGEMRREFVFFTSYMKCDFLQVVHNVTVDYCLKNEDRHPCKEDGMSFSEAMEYVTPEMLAPYGMDILWPNREAVWLEDSQKIVSHYEIESYAEVKVQEQHRAFLWERKLRETSERYSHHS